MSRKKQMKVSLADEVILYLRQRAEDACTSPGQEAARAITERMRSEKRKANRARTSARA